MKLSLHQLILRRLIEIVRSPLFYGMVSAFIIFGAIVGPFGAVRTLGFFERLVLSIETNLYLWTIGTLVAVPVRLTMQRIHPNRVLALTVACLCATVVITPILQYLVFLRLGENLNTSKFFEYSVLFLLVAWGMIYISVKVSRKSAGGERADVASENSIYLNEVHLLPEALAAKMPVNKVGNLYALVAQDHYVEIITERGSHLVLMRLSDAVAEVSDNHGMLTHRSAWVSFGAVDVVKRKKRKAFAVLLNGREVPVARAQENELRLRMSELSYRPEEANLEQLPHPIS